jgi:hypothetical protein
VVAVAVAVVVAVAVAVVGAVAVAVAVGEVDNYFHKYFQIYMDPHYQRYIYYFYMTILVAAMV